MTTRFAKLTIALLTTFLASACKSPPVTVLTEQYTNWKSYALTSEIFAATGSPMISVREGHFLPNFIALSEFTPTGLRPPPFGVEWVARHRFHGNCGDAQYVITNPQWYEGVIGFVTNADGDLPCELAVLEVRPPKLFKNS